MSSPAEKDAIADTEKELKELLSLGRAELLKEPRVEEVVEDDVKQEAAEDAEVQQLLPGAEAEAASPRTALRAAVSRKPVVPRFGASAASKKTKKKKKKRKKSSSATAASSRGGVKSSAATSSSSLSQKRSVSASILRRDSNVRSAAARDGPAAARLRLERKKSMRNEKPKATASGGRLTPQLSESIMFAEHFHQESTSNVNDKLRIRELEHHVSLLQQERENNRIAFQSKLEKAEIKNTLYGTQIDKLTTQVERLVSRNADTAAERVEANLNLEQAESKINELENNSQTLRKLLTELLGRPSEAKRQSSEEKAFWDAMATPEVLSKSRPPSSFQIDNFDGLEIVQAHPKYSQELDAVRAKMRQSEIQLKKIQNKYEDLQKEYSAQRAAATARDAAAKALIERQRKWLMGTVRRIKWVIKRREEVETQLKDRSAYVSKLETKLLHQAMLLRKLRSSRSKAPTKSRSRPRDSEEPGSINIVGEASSMAASMRLSRAEDVIDAPGSPHLRHTLSSMMNSPRPSSRAPAASPLKSPPVPETDDIDFANEDLEGFAAQLEAELDNE